MTKFDDLHPAVQHAVILMLLAPVVAFVGVFTLAVLTAAGVQGVDWSSTARTAVDAAAVSEATGVSTMVAMYFLPLTKQYGAFKDSSAGE